MHKLDINRLRAICAKNDRITNPFGLEVENRDLDEVLSALPGLLDIAELTSSCVLSLDKLRRFYDV